ncbi:MAG TPA: hypothetical protein VNN73_17090 [Blastocatellia bacterium]|nr:hypothetical protein [Blastocatellia bacterium]
MQQSCLFIHSHSRCASIARCAAIILFIALFSSFAYGQNCKRLEPAGEGRDDAARINECLATKGRAKLKAGTFLLYSPIFFPRNKAGAEVSDVLLRGKGMNETKLVAMSDCANHWPFVVEQTPGQYQPVIQAVRSPGATISQLEVDVTRLRRDCGYLGNSIVVVNRSPGASVTEIRVRGSRYGSEDYTTGGAHCGGILVVNSEESEINNNEIIDVGFAFEAGDEMVGRASAGHAGIEVISSASSKVQNNRVTRAAFGIEIVNGSPELGYTGNSSGTVVTNNTVVGAANVNCRECSQGRGIKLQACGTGSEPPLENLIVSDNLVTEFGGRSDYISGSGLDLVCGVRYSRFENNKFIGGPSAEFGLQIRSSFVSPLNPTHHNVFNFNTFTSGRGQFPCADHCSDVIFTPDGPDQIGIRRKGDDRAGTNDVFNFRFSTDRDCADYSHAFYLYLNDRQYVRQGEELLLSASGVRPRSSVTFRFRRVEDDSEVAVFISQRVNKNCIMNQELLKIDPTIFSPGYYKVIAEYEDGNTDNVTITGDAIGTIRIKPAKNE